MVYHNADSVALRRLHNADSVALRRLSVIRVTYGKKNNYLREILRTTIFFIKSYFQ